MGKETKNKNKEEGVWGAARQVVFSTGGLPAYNRIQKAGGSANRQTTTRNKTTKEFRV